MKFAAFQTHLVKVHNHRGAVICVAQLTERLMPGVAHSYESCRMGATGKVGTQLIKADVNVPPAYPNQKKHSMANGLSMVQLKNGMVIFPSIETFH